MNGQKLEASVKLHEGLRLRAYRDTKGIWTAGYGHNLQVMTITQETADNWLAEDLYAAHQEAKKFPEYQFLDTDARQNVMIELVLNMGFSRVKGFTATLKAIAAKDWETAAKELLDSKWAKVDVSPERSRTLSEMLRTGEFPA